MTLPSHSFSRHSFHETKAECDCGQVYDTTEHIESDRAYRHGCETVYVPEEEVDAWEVEVAEAFDKLRAQLQSESEAKTEAENERDFYLSECETVAAIYNALHHLRYNPSVHQHVLWYPDLTALMEERPLLKGTGEWFTLNTLGPLSDSPAPSSSSAPNSSPTPV